MNGELPEYHMARVLNDDTDDEVQIFTVEDLKAAGSSNRRSFLRSSLSMGTALAILGMPRAGMAASTGQTSCKNKAVAHSGSVRGLVVSPDGNRLASVGSDKLLKIWSLPSGLLIHSLTLPRDPADLAVSDTGAYLAVAAGDQVQLRRLPDGNLLGVKAGQILTHASHVAFSPTGETLYILTDEWLSAWSVPKLRLEHVAAVENGKFLGLAIDPTGHYLATANSSHVTAHDRRDLSEVARATVSTRARSLAIGPDGALLAAHGGRSKIRLFGLPRLDPHGPNGYLSSRNGTVPAVCFTVDGGSLVVAGENNTVQVLSVQSGRLAHKFVGHKDDVTAIAVTPDGSHIASASADRTIRLWHIKTGEQVTCLTDPEAKPPDPPKKTRPSTSRSTGGSYSRQYCSCNKVCTCIPVRCQAHRLLDPDPVVRTMARQVLLHAGAGAFGYLDWVAHWANAPIQAAIATLKDEIAAGSPPDADQWPSEFECARRMQSEERIVALMAAQIIRLRSFRRDQTVSEALRLRSSRLIKDAMSRSVFDFLEPAAAGARTRGGP